MNQPEKSSPDTGIVVQILFISAMFIAILAGVRNGLAMILPVDWCGSTPVEPFIYVLSTVISIQIASPKMESGIWRNLRLGGGTIVGLTVAVLAAQLTAGCTFVNEWPEDSRVIVEAVVMFTILVSLAELYRHIIVPRWIDRRDS